MRRTVLLVVLAVLGAACGGVAELDDLVDAGDVAVAPPTGEDGSVDV